MRFRKHQDVETPHGRTIVWRYMGLDKFLDLLTHQRLFFANAEHLTDSFEVSLPPNIVKAQRRGLEARGLRGRDVADELAAWKCENQPLRHLTLVNCWSLGREESYALWKIYLGGSRAGVAIRTNFSRLKRSITAAPDDYPEDFFAGTVQYRNYLSQQDVSRYRIVTTKRVFYTYEQELRLFILHYPRSEGGDQPPYNRSVGRRVRVDINELVDRVYISPFVASWFADSLRQIVEKAAPALAERLIASSIRDQ